MTLTLGFQRSNFEAPGAQDWICLVWNATEGNWLDDGLTLWHRPLATLMTLTLDFQGHSLIEPYFINARPIGMEWKGFNAIVHDRDRYIWMTRVGWVNVLDTNRRDFQCRHAVDTTIFLYRAYIFICIDDFEKYHYIPILFCLVSFFIIPIAFKLTEVLWTFISHRCGLNSFEIERREMISNLVLCDQWGQPKRRWCAWIMNKQVARK